MDKQFFLDVLASQRKNVEIAVEGDDEHQMIFEAITLQSIVNLYYSRDLISFEELTAHYDYAEEVIGSSANFICNKLNKS